MIGGDEPVSVQPPPPSGEGSNASIGASASESYGLVAPDMMDVVEHARTATRDDIKANVLWSFDLAQREWHRHGVPSVRRRPKARLVFLGAHLLSRADRLRRD